MDVKKAAVIAKDASIDFDQMGQWGSIINSLWLFSNPSIQGTYKTARALIKSPKTLTGSTIALAAPIWAINSWNERVDPEYRKKISDWDRKNGMNIVLPSEEFNYIHIPVSYGVKPLFNIINRGYDLASGVDIDIEEIPMDNLLKIEYPSTWVLDPDFLVEAIKDAEIYSEILNINANEGQGLIFSSSGQIGEMEYDLNEEDLIESDLQGTSTGAYSLTFLKAILKIASISKNEIKKGSRSYINIYIYNRFNFYNDSFHSVEHVQ